MQNISNEETFNKLQAAYAAGSLSDALETMHEDVIWDISGPATVSYAGVFYGHDGFSKFWQLLSETVTIKSAGVRLKLFGADKALVAGGEAGIVTATKRPYHYDWAIEYHFDSDHKIILMRQYYDPSRIRASI